MIKSLEKKKNILEKNKILGKLLYIIKLREKMKDQTKLTIIFKGKTNNNLFELEKGFKKGEDSYLFNQLKDLREKFNHKL